MFTSRRRLSIEIFVALQIRRNQNEGEIENFHSQLFVTHHRENGLRITYFERGAANFQNVDEIIASRCSLMRLNYCFSRLALASYNCNAEYGKFLLVTKKSPLNTVELHSYGNSHFLGFRAKYSIILKHILESFMNHQNHVLSP